MSEIDIEASIALAREAEPEFTEREAESFARILRGESTRRAESVRLAGTMGAEYRDQGNQMPPEASASISRLLCALIFHVVDVNGDHRNDPETIANYKPPTPVTVQFTLSRGEHDAQWLDYMIAEVGGDPDLWARRPHRRRSPARHRADPGEVGAHDRARRREHALDRRAARGSRCPRRVAEAPPPAALGLGHVRLAQTESVEPAGRSVTRPVVALDVVSIEQVIATARLSTRPRCRPSTLAPGAR